MANGVWFYTSQLLDSGAASRLADCAARGLFDIYWEVGYPSPGQGTVTFPSLSGFVPNTETGIQVTQSQVQTVRALLASVDPRLKLWAWFGTYSTDTTPVPGYAPGDATGHYHAKIDVDTPARRAAVIEACLTVARWGFYGIQDDTEDLRPASLEPSGQFGSVYVAFTNAFAVAAKAEGFKYVPFVPVVWLAFNANWLNQITEPNEIIVANPVSDPGPRSASNPADFYDLYEGFFANCQRPIIFNFGWPATAPWLATRLEAWPFSTVANKIVGYSWYTYSDWQGNWGLWDSWRAAHPLPVAADPVTTRIFPASVARTVAQAIANAAVGSKRAAGAAALSSAIGSNPRLRLRRNGVVVLDVTFQGALASSSAGLVVPAYTTLLSVADADADLPAYDGTINPAGWVMRLGRADDSVYVEAAVGAATSAAPFKLSADLDDAKGFAASITLAFSASIDG